MRNPTASEIQAVETVYKAAHKKFTELAERPRYRDRGVKYTILHSRLRIAPNLLVVGDRPNLEKVDQLPPNLPQDDSRSLWLGDYVLAFMTTAMFARAERLSLLNESQFFDTNFFSKLRDGTNKAASEAFTAETRKFSLRRFRTLVQLINPRTIVTIGESAFRTIADVPESRFTELVSRNRRYWYDTIPGIQRIPVYPIVHPSWAPKQPELYRLSLEQLRAISVA